MTPQQVHSDADLRFEIGTVLKYPNLALLAMHVVEIWSYNDMIMRGILANFLGVEIEKATIMLQATKNQDAQMDMICEVAKISLANRGDDYQIFRATLDATKASANQRHIFAHHIWGISAMHPDAFILAEPRSLNMALAKARGAIERLRLDPQHTQSPKLEIDRDKMRYYKEHDFVTAANNAQWAHQQISQLDRFTNPRVDERAVEAIRQKLLAEPLIQTRFAHRKTHNAP